MSNHLADDLLIDAEDQDSSPPPMLRRWLLGLAMLVVACNLRPALTSLGPVLTEIRHDLPQLGWLSGVLTMLPVLCMGLAGPFAPMQARRWGAERVILGWLAVLIAGLALRGLGNVVPLFTGTALAGIAIGIVGVLLPGLVKRDFRDHGTLMTGLFTMALCWGAAFAAGISVPLTHALDGAWALALGAWALPAVIAAVVWWPTLPKRDAAAAPALHPVRGLWRQALAWQVTLFMGLQSALAYAVFGWLAPILRDRGLDPALAGWVVSFSVVVQLPAALITPILAGRARDQRAAVAIVLGATLAGLLGCFYAPLGGIWLWAALLGVGQGGAFSLALTLIVLRAKDSHVAAQLSSMAQSAGYTVAAFCPLALGALHDFAGSWDGAGPLVALVALAALWAGLGAGRQIHISGAPS
ncbi:MAG: MFS transporter [Rhodospirillaceae bacterium]|nr:MFS transporter [Rhodospirillales bacterium]